MNKREKEIVQFQLKAEEDVIHELEKQYRVSLNEINQKIKLFDYDINMLDNAINGEGLDDAARAVLQSQKRAKIYQKQYQEALQGQISGILDRMQGNNYSTIESYLKQSYEDAFLGTVYDIHGQGIPLIMPIDQAAAVKAIMTDSKISKGLYNALGVDVKGLKKAIRLEITRGIGSSLSYSEIARNIANKAKAPLSRAKTIARTEGHRIQQQSADDVRKGAIKRGCDVVKQWDAALDGRTRPNHRRLDGQIREEDEPFEIGGMKAMFPSEFGDPAEDCNCRCVALTRARWALDEAELDTLKQRAEYFGLDKSKDFDDFKEKYLSANKMAANSERDNDWTKTSGKQISFDEKGQILQYAADRGIAIGDIDGFDGDVELLKSSIDTVATTCKEYGIKGAVTVNSRILDDDRDFAITEDHAITFNSKALRDRITTEFNIASGNWFASKSLEDIALHEIAHIFAMENSVNGLEIAKKAYYNVNGKYISTKQLYQYLNTEVSKYATENPAELIAETTVGNKNKPNAFTKEFVLLLKGQTQ